MDTSREPLSEVLRSKLPTRQEIIPVFSVILFIVFSWTLYRMFWQVPSWLGDLSVWGVMINAAYVLAFALFESLVLLGMIIITSLVFPVHRFKQYFVAQGSTVMFSLAVGAFLLQRKMRIVYTLDIRETTLYPILVLLVLVLLIFFYSIIFERFGKIPRTINAIADRMTVFAILYVPLGILGLIIVLLRNIL